MSRNINLNATNFEDVLITFNTSKRSAGYIENLTMKVDEPITRVSRYLIEDVQFPNTGYLFNSGNNTLVFRFNGNKTNLVILPGNYSADELAAEITNRMSENPSGTLFNFLCTYNSFTNLFTFSEILTDLARVVTRQNVLVDKGFPLDEYSPLSVPLSLARQPDEFGFSFLLNSINATADPDNPGEFLISSTYKSFGRYGIISKTTLFGWAESANLANVTIDTTANITGFALATEFETAFNTEPELSGFSVAYNYNNYKLRIFNPDLFSIVYFQLKVGSGASSTLININVSENTELDVEILPTPITHDIMAGNNTMIFDEGNGNVSIILDDFMDAELSQLAPFLQDAMNNSALLNFTYEVVFTERTGIFKIKNTNLIDTFIVRSAGDASASFGFTGDSSNSVINYSDTQQFGLVPKITATLFQVLQYGTVELPIGNYTQTEIATIIDTDVAADPYFINTYSVTYNDNTNLFEIEKTGGAEFIISIHADSNTQGAFSILGFVNFIDSPAIVAGDIVSGTAIADFNENLYLYIKSNFLTSKRVTLSGASDSYQNVIGKIILNTDMPTPTFTQKTISTVNSISNNVTVEDLDFRIVDENDVLYNLNGKDVSFTMVFERF